jgi:hypothetical protein
MELKVKDIEKEELGKVDKILETNQEATERIQAELRADTAMKARRDVVMDYFFEITGEPMTLEQFEKYNKLLNSNKTETGYNIKSFIRDEKIIKKIHNTLNPLDDFNDFCKREEIPIKDGENINNGSGEA